MSVYTEILEAIERQKSTRTLEEWTPPRRLSKPWRQSSAVFLCWNSQADVSVEFGRLIIVSETIEIVFFSFYAATHADWLISWVWVLAYFLFTVADKTLQSTPAILIWFFFCLFVCDFLMLSCSKWNGFCAAHFAIAHSGCYLAVAVIQAPPTMLVQGQCCVQNGFCLLLTIVLSVGQVFKFFWLSVGDV